MNLPRPSTAMSADEKFKRIIAERDNKIEVRDERQLGLHASRLCGPADCRRECTTFVRDNVYRLTRMLSTLI